MGSIFGGSKSKTENQAYGTIKNWAGGLLDYTKEGASGLSSLLGGDASGFNKFKNALGYDWELGQGTGDVMSRQASIGGLDSGATLKALARYQTGLNNQYAGNYMQNLLGLSGVGTNAAQVLTSAGQKSTSSSSPGIGGFLGKVAAGIATGGASLAMPGGF